MKKTATFLLLVFTFFTSCEEVVQIDVPSGEPKLIIDASFKVFFDETPVTAETIVKLSLSADYFEDEIPAVSNATVFITNLSDNSITNFSDANQNGNFTPTSTFIPADEVAYELTVIYEGETFKARATKEKAPPFIDVVQGEETLFSGNETQVLVSFADDGTRDNYYVFDFDNSLYVSIEDRFFNGSNYNFSFFYQEDEITLPADLTIQLSGVTEDYYNFFRVLVNQGGQNSGGPFQTVPASLLGNIVNTTNFDNFAFGYFHISETDTFNINLIENN